MKPSLLLSLPLRPRGGVGAANGKPGEPTGDTEPGERLYGDTLWWRWGWKCGPGERAMVVVAFGPDGDVPACWTWTAFVGIVREAWEAVEAEFEVDVERVVAP